MKKPAACAVVAMVAMVGACGGRVDARLDRSAGPSGTATAGRRPPGGGTTRPQPVPTTPASAASEIAETYCKTFSSCCVGAKLPPIDVARCRELTSAAVSRRLEQASSAMSATDVVQCVDAIKTRTAACGKEDYPWWQVSDVALFGPETIQKACAALVGPSKPVTGQACSGGAGASCMGAGVCAIDVCVDLPLAGESCAPPMGSSGDVCLDGASCIAGTCERGEAAPDATCTIDEECRLGLVCVKDACAPARLHPEQYEERHSPYRVGADTCKAFTDL